MSQNASTQSVKLSAFMRGAIIAAVAFAIALAVPKTGTAQALYSGIVGTVTDSSGAAVPGAKVTVTQEQTKLVRTVVTNSSGQYSLPTLPAGTYDVKVSKQGFRAFVKTSIEVEYNSTARVDATLHVGEITQSVSVSGAAPVLQTTNANVHHNITTVQLENVPLAPGNNFEHLFQAVPGINPPSSAHSIPTNPSRGLSFNSNGTSQLTNSIQIDGVSQWSIWVPEVASYIPSSDAIATVNITTNNFNINQGFAGGASANVEIKSGTNAFHGDAYEYHYDNKLQALEFFAARNHITRSPKDIYNMFGGSVGGPIKKNKLFFFSNWEFTREYVFAQTNATIPSPAMMAGDLRNLSPGSPGTVLGSTAINPDLVFDPATGTASGQGRTPIYATNNSGDPATYNQACQAGDPGSTLMGNGYTMCQNVIPTSRISPIAAKLLALMPGQSLPTGTSYEADNNFISRTDVNYRRYTTDDKINWNATDKFTMFGHFGYLHYSTYNPQIFGKLGGPQASGFIGNEGLGDGHTITFALTGNYIVTPNFVIDVNGGMTRQTTNAYQQDLATKEGTAIGLAGVNGTRRFEGSWPGFYISGFSNLGTQHNFMPYFRNDPQFFYSGDANWIHGKHTVRFGGAIEIQHLNEQQPEWNAGGTAYPAAGGFNFGSGPTRCQSSLTGTTAVAANCYDATLGSGSDSPSNNYNDFATFLLGLNTGWGKNIMVPNYFHTDTKMYALYVGDTWQVTHKLTATGGVRWEYYPFPTRGGTPAGVEKYNFNTGQVLNCGEGGNPIDCGVSVGWKYFSPRLGLAYRASNNFVIRAGYGMTYSPFNLIDDLRTAYPVLIPLSQVTPSSLTAAGAMDTASLQNTPGGECATYPTFCYGSGGTLPVGVVNPSPFPSVTAASNPIPGNVNLVTTLNKVKRGYIQSWNLTLQRSLPHGWVASAGYVATRTVNQLGLLDINVENLNAPGGCTLNVDCGGGLSRLLNYNGGNTALCSSAQSTALGCRTGGTSVVTNVGNYHYDSLQATLNHRWAHGYSINLAYTWSKTIGVAGCGDQKSNCPSIPLPAYYSLNQGLASFDRPQNFEAVFVAQPPMGAGKRFFNTGIASKVLGGWQVSGLITSVSNTPVGLSASGSSLNASGNHQNPDRLCSSIGTPKAVGYGQNWFNTNCFSGVNTQRFGNSAEYVFHGPHLFNMDAALFRSFKLTERFGLRFRAQAFNFTNTPAFSNPDSSCGSIPSGATSGCDSSSFGQVRGTTNFARHGENFREFEFSAKVTF